MDIVCQELEQNDYKLNGNRQNYYLFTLHASIHFAVTLTGFTLKYSNPNLNIIFLTLKYLTLFLL